VFTPLTSDCASHGRQPLGTHFTFWDQQARYQGAQVTGEHATFDMLSSLPLPKSYHNSSPLSKSNINSLTQPTQPSQSTLQGRIHSAYAIVRHLYLFSNTNYTNMVTTTPYAALDNAALQALAQLRGLSPDGDKMQILERMTAQDRATGTSVKVAVEAPVDAKKRDSVADEAGWEIAGAHKKRKSKGSSNTSLEEAGCPQDTGAIEAEDDAVPMAKDEAVAPEPVTVDVSNEQADSFLGHDVGPGSKEVLSESAKEQSADSPKKKRKRGKKGGKKVNKKTATPPENIQAAPKTDEVPLEVQKLAFEPVDCLVGKMAPEATGDSQEAPTDEVSTEAQEAAIDATNPIQSSEDHHDAAIDEIPDELQQPAIETLTPIDVSGVSDNLLDDVAPIVEQSPSVAPTETGEPVDLQIVLDLEQMEKDEALGDMQAPISQDIDALMHPEHTTLAPQEPPTEITGPTWEPSKKKKKTRVKRHTPAGIFGSAASDEASITDEEDGGSTAPMPGERNNLRAWPYTPKNSVSESSAYEPSPSGAPTSEDTSLKKKNRKRGNKRGKKVQKKKTSTPDNGLKLGKVSVAMVVAAVIAAGLGFALGKR